LVSLSNKQFYAEAKDRFGDDYHISGAGTERVGCLVFMRSKKPDDTSKTTLDAKTTLDGVKEASSHL
jgi:hypothetical protein